MTAQRSEAKCHQTFSPSSGSGLPSDGDRAPCDEYPYQQLFVAIEAQDIDQVRRLLAEGADPSAIDDHGNSPLMDACDSWKEPQARLAMVSALLDAGADPTFTDKDGGGVLFAAVIAKDAALVDYLISRGADPNTEHDSGETLYSWAEFDYRQDEYHQGLPEKATQADRASVDTWLAYLSRLAVKYGKRPPDYLIALRKAGALTNQERARIRA